MKVFGRARMILSKNKAWNGGVNGSSTNRLAALHVSSVVRGNVVDVEIRTNAFRPGVRSEGDM